MYGIIEVSHGEQVLKICLWLAQKDELILDLYFDRINQKFNKISYRYNIV